MRLFESKFEMAIFIGVCLAIFAANVTWEYFKFEKFVADGRVEITAKVLLNYVKNGAKSDYRVLKLRADGFDFYTTTRRKNFSAAVTLVADTSGVSFAEYLKKTFYMPSYKLRAAPLKKGVRERLYDLVAARHENPKMKELFAALFLAAPVSRELRADVTNWGVAHIISISGFHLGLLFAIAFFILRPPYRALQSRYFPWRDANFDLSFFILACAGFYLWILDFTPSFLRSYLMGVVGFFFLARGLGVFKFENLFVCAALALAFNPSLLFSIGFYFSALGVFFIFLYIHHFGDARDLESAPKMLAHTLLLELFVFSAMNVPVYYFFHPAGVFQLSVIPLGYAFSVFYPLEIALHLLGRGDLLDEYLLRFIPLASSSAQISVHPLIFWAFNALLLPAIKFKWLAVFLAVFGMAVYTFGLIQI